MALTFSIQGPDGRDIVRGAIRNDGTGTRGRGNYDVALLQRDPGGEMRPSAWRVNGFRRSRGAEVLVATVLSRASRPAPKGA